jgi:hypothetical protein
VTKIDTRTDYVEISVAISLRLGAEWIGWNERVFPVGVDQQDLSKRGNLGFTAKSTWNYRVSIAVD